MWRFFVRTAPGFLLILLFLPLLAHGQDPGQTSETAQASQSTQEAAPQATAQAGAAKDPLRWETHGYTIKVSAQAGLQVVGEWNSWWNLAATFAPTANYAPSRYWFEGYAETGVTVSKELTDRFGFTAGVSGIASGNERKDVFLAGDSGRVLLENAYVGGHYKATPNTTVSLSGGSQQFKVGNGFLLSTGAANGFERGATVFGPRLAWKYTGISRVDYKKWSIAGYYLRPNELKSSDSHTELAGGLAEYRPRQGEYVGLLYINVFRSEYPYAQAPVTLIPNGRDGLQVINPYLKLSPAKEKLPGLLITADFAREWNKRINLTAWAFSTQVGYTFLKTKWMPTIHYAYRYYSGDNPNTTRLERFDALFYDSGVTSFAAGSNGSLAFYNSNINLHRIWLNLLFSPRDIFDTTYTHIQASQVNSPIQFGQGFRVTFNNGVPSLIAGVPTANLSDDFYAGYTRIVTRHIFVSLGATYSRPGAGLQAITEGTAKNWPGAYANVLFQY